MALITPEEARKRKLSGYAPNKSRSCDHCKKTIGSVHFVVGKQDACSTECRASLEGKVVDKSSKEDTTLKKDNGKKAKVKEDTKKKGKDEEIDEPEEDVDTDPDTGEDDDDEGEVVDTSDDTPEDPEDDKPKKGKKKSKDADEEEEGEKPAKGKKKKDAEDDVEEKPAKNGKKAKDDEDEDDEDEPKKGKDKKAPAKPVAKSKDKSAGKKAIKEPYKYRTGSTLAKLFTRLSDGKWHVQGELFKGLTSPEVPFSRLKIHAARFKWDWKEKGDQVKLIVPKDVIELQK